MRKLSKSALMKKCDKLWSEITKLKVKGCEYCGQTYGLNSHHIFSRANHSMRHNLNNCAVLCPKHHVFSSQFSAHLTPTEFVEWLKETRGEKWYAELRQQASQVNKPNYELIKIGLEEIKKSL